MTVSFISHAIVSDVVNDITIIGCIVFTLIAGITDTEQNTTLGRLNRASTVFMLPLFIVFAYLVSLWAIKIIIIAGR